MSINSEFFKFIFISFLFSCMITSLSISSVVFIGDVVEYAKKLTGYSDNNIKLLIQLSFKFTKNAYGNITICFFVWRYVMDN